MLNDSQFREFERQAIIAALFKICDPHGMENLKLGDTVQLKSGGPIMTLGKETGSRGTYSCAWFDGATLRHGSFPIEQLKKVEPSDEGPYIGIVE